MMKTNEGRIDRTLRVVAGFYFLLKSFGCQWFVGRWTKGLLGTLLLATGALGVCPMYEALGINTLQADEEATDVLG